MNFSRLKQLVRFNMFVFDKVNTELEDLMNWNAQDTDHRPHFNEYIFHIFKLKQESLDKNEERFRSGMAKSRVLFNGSSLQYSLLNIETFHNNVHFYVV